MHAGVTGDGRVAGACAVHEQVLAGRATADGVQHITVGGEMPGAQGVRDAKTSTSRVQTDQAGQRVLRRRVQTELRDFLGQAGRGSGPGKAC